MRRNDVLQLLEASHQEFARFGVRRLALFGSVARDEAGPESDIDILVEFEEPATFDRYVELCFFLEDLLGRRVDLVTHRSLPADLRASIEGDACYVSELRTVPG